ncbi:MAG: CAP domain-containing protein, partial [Acidimicrobiales bacterium]
MTLVAALLWLLIAQSPAGASPASDEGTFVALINDYRASNGLPALVVDNQLTGLARQWAGNMAARDTLDHAGDLSVGVSTDWDVLGENVGVHSVHDLTALFQAFVASPGHRANLLDPRFDYVGVGVVHGPDGKIWTTHRFRSVPGSIAPPPPPPTTPPPAPTAPPTVPPAPA